MKELTWNSEFGTGGTIKATCDYCGKGHLFKFKSKPNYKSVQEKLKAQGWIARKIDDNWHDFCCQDCFNQFEDDLIDGGK